MQALLEGAKVATVAGRAFYIDGAKGKKQLRFCFALTKEKVAQALDKIQQIL